MSLSEDNFDYFYDIFIAKLKDEQLNDVLVISSFCSEVLELRDNSVNPLKTVFKVSSDFYYDECSLRFCYKTGLGKSNHSNVRLYPDKLPQLQLDEIKVSGIDVKIKLVYETIYDKNPSSISIENNESIKRFTGSHALDYALSHCFNVSIANIIKFTFANTPPPSVMNLKQYVFNSNDKSFVVIDRPIGMFSANQYQLGVTIDKNIKT